MVSVIRCPKREMLGAAMWLGGRDRALFGGDLRAGVLGAVDGGMAARAAARVFRVSVSYIYKALIRRRRTGEASARSCRGHRPRKLTPAQRGRAAGGRASPAQHRTSPWRRCKPGCSTSTRYGSPNGAMWLGGSSGSGCHSKRRSMPLSKIVPTSRPGAASGARRSLLSMPTSSSSSTRPAPVPR